VHRYTLTSKSGTLPIVRKVRYGAFMAPHCSNNRTFHTMRTHFVTMFTNQIRAGMLELMFRDIDMIFAHGGLDAGDTYD
jgi:hypothetical protein